MKNFIIKNVLCALLAICSVSSFAWDGSEVGKVHRIDVAPAENYGFRVYLVGSPKLCGSDHAWAYLNGSDSNYQTFVSVILAAKAAQMKLRLHTTRDVNTGYCKIGYIVIE